MDKTINALSIKIYTDGGCHGNPGPGAWAFVVTAGGEVLAVNSGREERTTNNRMELTAAIRALEKIQSDASASFPASGGLTIVTDSQYVQRGITEWIGNWKARGWKSSTKKPVLNQDLWQRLDALSETLGVKWEWVRGHNGNPFNEQADSLVQEAIGG
jgi:ribonuclease HI